MPHSVINLLVADDAATIHQIFDRATKAFPDAQFRVVHAENGRDCLQALAKGQIDLAFIDIVMPEMSGLDALAKARFMGDKTFVTIMSAQANDRVFALARELRSYEFLIKPFKPKDVEAILATYRCVHKRLSALVVDDSGTTRAIVRKVLARSIFRIDVEERANGSAAVELCRSRTFDVVFLDCNMPGLDGAETLARLLARDPSTKVVMMTAQPGKYVGRELLNSGASAFLHKPFHPHDVDFVIHRIFGLRRPRLAVFKPAAAAQFDVSIVGRTIEVTHRETGHLYRFLWFHDAPHLRGAYVVPGPNTDLPVTMFRATAEDAATSEIKSSGLLDDAAAEASVNATFAPHIQKYAILAHL